MQKSILFQKLRSAGVLTVAMGSSAVFAEGTDVAASFAGLQTQFIGYIAAAGLAGAAIMAVAMGWDVGMSVFKKFMKKGAK